MRISEAARRLGTSARMLRYREDLGLLPPVRDEMAFGAGPPRDRRFQDGPRQDGPPRDRRFRDGPRQDGPLRDGRLRDGRLRDGRLRDGPRGPSHRQFGQAELEAVAAALELERRYDISPASLAFGLRVLAEPGVRAAVADLGRRLGRIPATPGRALDFEKERALRLLSGR
jgi:MerR family transcriptional regulator, copper efflux regulator